MVLQVGSHGHKRYFHFQLEQYYYCLPQLSRNDIQGKAWTEWTQCNALKVDISWGNFASRGPFFSNHGLPIGSSAMILRPDTDSLHTPSLSLAAQLPTILDQEEGVSSHCTQLAFCRYRGQSQAKAHCPHLREWIMEEMALWFPVHTEGLCSAWGPTCDGFNSWMEIGKLLCFKELVLRTQWQNLPGFPCPWFTYWHSALKIHLPDLGHHPSQ